MNKKAASKTQPRRLTARILIPALFLAATSLILGSCSNDDPVATYPGYVLDWQDEFNGRELDKSIWRHAVGGGGFGNNEMQFYTNEPTNSRTEKGLLVIEARKEKKAGWPYTSAKLMTWERKPMLYGRVDVKAKLPKGVGSWPAIWMLPEVGNTYGMGWPDSGEIDIMEHVGYDQDNVIVTIHTAAYNHKIGTQKSGSRRIPGAAENFHVYSMEWTPDYIRWFIDNDEVYTFENPGTGWEAWPFDHPYHLILNIAVGGDWGGRMGIDNESLPWRMEVDYVRVYKPAP